MSEAVTSMACAEKCCHELISVALYLVRGAKILLPNGGKTKKTRICRSHANARPFSPHRVLNNDGNYCKLGHDTIFFG